MKKTAVSIFRINATYSAFQGMDYLPTPNVTKFYRVIVAYYSGVVAKPSYTMAMASFHYENTAPYSHYSRTASMGAKRPS